MTTDVHRPDNIDPTPQELEWAVAIKRAAAQDPEVNTAAMMDLEFLQHGIIAKSNVDKALKRIKRMQQLKERYGIKLDGSVEDGIRDVQAFSAAHPRFGLCWQPLEDHTHVVCSDYQHFRADRMHSEEGFAMMMRCFFYMMQMCQPHAAAMRAGLVFLMDTQHMGRRNFSWQVEERMSTVIFNAYPARVQKVAILNPSWIMRTIFAFCMRVLSPKARNTHVFCKHPTTFFKEAGYPREVLPDAWGGTFPSKDVEKIKQMVRQMLQQRYGYAAKFRLQDEEEEDEED